MKTNQKEVEDQIKRMGWKTRRSLFRRVRATKWPVDTGWRKSWDELLQTVMAFNGMQVMKGGVR